MLFSKGNAANDGAPFNFWFIGDLTSWAKRDSAAVQQQRDFGLRQSASVEMKWGLHRGGEQRADWAACSDRKTISLLVRGKFLVRFRSPEDRGHIIEQRLECEGDYAVWGSDSEHTWIAEEDSVIFTVRWQEESPR